jgi:hypothetical protein
MSSNVFGTQGHDQLAISTSYAHQGCSCMHELAACKNSRHDSMILAHSMWFTEWLAYGSARHRVAKLALAGRVNLSECKLIQQDVRVTITEGHVSFSPVLVSYNRCRNRDQAEVHDAALRKDIFPWNLLERLFDYGTHQVLCRCAFRRLRCLCCNSESKNQWH